MRREQNVIVFSAGESVRSGRVDRIMALLEARGIRCFGWSSLFCRAHDMDHIALLPGLIKKIPTFDFALIIAEGVDTALLRGNDREHIMRDNVLFELGLCVMGLGPERVILLADPEVRVPEDLVGVDGLGVTRIPLGVGGDEGVAGMVQDVMDRGSGGTSGEIRAWVDRILTHIHSQADQVGPVFIGAAVSSAEAYFMNFIVRLLEHLEGGFCSVRSPEARIACPGSVRVRVLLPGSVSALSRERIDRYYDRQGYDAYMIRDAGPRGLFFRGSYRPGEDLLTVVDIPTSVSASYTLVNAVLDLDSDDDHDPLAEERFLAKEMDVYAYALEKLMTPEMARVRLAFLADPERVEGMIRRLETVRVEFMPADG